MDIEILKELIGILLTGKLVISEHGPSGERGFAHDEINVIEVWKKLWMAKSNW